MVRVVSFKKGPSNMQNSKMVDKDGIDGVAVGGENKENEVKEQN